jgi:hypothetical protein
MRAIDPGRRHRLSSRCRANHTGTHFDRGFAMELRKPDDNYVAAALTSSVAAAISNARSQLAMT